MGGAKRCPPDVLAEPRHTRVAAGEAKEAGRYTGLQFELAPFDVVDLDQLGRA
jgi:hypothetical protein